MEIRDRDIIMFIDRALEGMLNIAEELGDERVNAVPDLTGANSAYGILNHCVGMATYWIGHLLGGGSPARDRPAEFVAQGTVSELRDKVKALQKQIRLDVEHMQSDQPLTSPPRSEFNPIPLDPQDVMQGTALLHSYEELAQHRGQMELTRDIVMRTSD